MMFLERVSFNWLLLFLLVFYGLFLKIIIQTYRIIKNKVLYIKIILKILKKVKDISSFQIEFYFTKH